MPRYRVTTRKWFYADLDLEIEADNREEAARLAREQGDEYADAQGLDFEDLWPDKMTVTHAVRIKDNE